MSVEPDQADLLILAAVELGYSRDCAYRNGMVAAEHQRDLAIGLPSVDGVLGPDGGHLCPQPWTLLLGRRSFQQRHAPEPRRGIDHRCHDTPSVAAGSDGGVLLDAGHAFDCFEASTVAGGLWVSFVVMLVVYAGMGIAAVISTAYLQFSADRDFADVEGLTPFVTPNADFYRIDTALVVPQVPIDTWTGHGSGFRPISP